jgi:CRISPR/Cas system endoribonuclease Cas6 (RAMP superfamily)
MLGQKSEIRFRKYHGIEGRKVNRSTQAVVKMNEINPKYENARKMHRLLSNQNPGFLYKV